MEFRVLGPLAVVRGSRPVAIGGPQRGLLLAALLSEANHPVLDVKLLRAIYGEDDWNTEQRPKILHRLRVQISQLRVALGQQDGQAGQPIARVGDAYMLTVGPQELDEFAFQRLLEQARRCRDAGDTVGAADRTDEALELWRGDPLANLPMHPIVDTYAGRLHDLRFDAERERSAAYLAAGRHGALVGILPALIAGHPLDERLWMDLALALHRDGRRLEAAQACRDGLVQLREVGLDSAALRQRQSGILADDPSLRWVAPLPRTAPRGSVRSPQPAQLPADIGHFVGRGREVARLTALLNPTDRGQPGVRVAAVAGKAGVGKTALAVHVAHRLRAAFPDGALYVNLQATPDTPTDPQRALLSFLLVLGVPREAVPDELETRAALFRTTLDRYRMVLLLDNAKDSEQVRPLLPGGPSSAVLITSRRALTDLDADHTVLDVLDPPDAVALLGRVAGPDRIVAEADQAQAIVDLCGQLPLAVRIAGARLAQWPDTPLSWLRERLSNARLSNLRAGDLEVHASFELSYRALPRATQRAFRLLSVPQTERVGLPVAAALLDVDLDRAAEILDELAAIQLIDRKAGDDGEPRYRFHDLLRLFARERLEQEDDRAERQDALERALETYLAYGEAAAPRLLGGNRQVVPRTSPPRWTPPRGRAIRAAVDNPSRWFDRERADLVALVEQAAEAGFDELTWLLSAALIDFFHIGAHWTDWQRTHEAALAAADREGNRLAAANTRRNLGRLLRLRGSHGKARELLESSLASFLAEGSAVGEAAARRSLAELDNDEARFTEAIAHLDRARELYRDLGEDFGSGRTLMTLGEVHLAAGRFDEAMTCSERAVDYFAGVDNPLCEEMARKALGGVYLHIGWITAAVNTLVVAERYFRAEGHTQLRAEALLLLGDAYARREWDEDAFRCYGICLPIFAERRDPLNQARTLARRGRLHAWRGQEAQARASWAQALAAFSNRGGSEEGEVRAWLDGLPPGPRLGPSAEHIRDHFDRESFMAHVAASEYSVRILATWTELLEDQFQERFLTALGRALANGALVQILLLAPHSLAAAERTRELGGGLDIGDLVRTNLRHLRRFISGLDSGQANHIEVRLYSASPFLAYYRWDTRALAAVLPFGGSSTRTTQYEVPVTSMLVQIIEQRFAELWNTGRTDW